MLTFLVRFLQQNTRVLLYRDLPGITDNDVTSQSLLLIDTAGCDLHELDLPDELSKGNEGRT